MRLVLSFLFISLCNQAFPMMSDSSEAEKAAMPPSEQRTFLDSLKTNPATQHQKTTRRIVYLLARLIPKNKSEQQADFLTNQLHQPLVSSVEELFNLGEIDMNILYKLHQDDILTGFGQTLRFPKKGAPESFTQWLGENSEAEKFWSLRKDHSVLSYPDFCSDAKYRFYRVLLAGQRDGKIVNYDDSPQINLDLGGVKIKDALYTMFKCHQLFGDDFDCKHAFDNFMPQEGTTSKTDSTNDPRNKRRVDLMHNTPQAKRQPFLLNRNNEEDEFQVALAIEASLEDMNNQEAHYNKSNEDHEDAIYRSFAVEGEASTSQPNQLLYIDETTAKLIEEISADPASTPDEKQRFIFECFKSNNDNEAIESTACASSAYPSELVYSKDTTTEEEEMTPEERRISKLPSKPSAEELRNLRLRNLERFRCKRHSDKFK